MSDSASSSSLPLCELDAPAELELELGADGGLSEPAEEPLRLPEPISWATLFEPGGATFSAAETAADCDC